MKSVKYYIINEGRPAGSKNKPKPFPEEPKKLEKDPRVANAVDVKDVDTKQVKPTDTDNVTPGKDADSNGTGGIWAVDPPSENWEAEWENLDVDSLDDNAYELAERFDSKHDFLVLGEAGWAKTSVIEAMAHKAGYNVITVYLDKADATDLGGIPVPKESEKTKATYMQYSMPGWALYMAEHPNDKFLLFFDEMNQAAPDVLNALMPIVLKHVVCGVTFPNMIVGAAGNLESENESLNTINKPLRDRFKPIITWQTHTEDSWKASYEWIHKEFDDELGAELINKFEEMGDCWNSPRDLTRVMFECLRAQKGIDKKFTRPSDILEDLEQCIYDEFDTDSRGFEDKLKKLAEYISRYIKGETTSDESSSRKRSKGTDQVHESDKEHIIRALEQGYFYNGGEDGDGKKYVVTVENAITAIFDPSITGVTAEVFRKLIKQMKAAGRAPMFETNEEGAKVAKQKGWEAVFEFKNGGYLVGDHIKNAEEPKQEEKPVSKKHDND